MDSLLERLAAEPEQAALLLDFDGVLAPIVAVPDAAAVPEETRIELRRAGGSIRPRRRRQRARW